jgi:hypothetical protein
MYSIVWMIERADGAVGVTRHTHDATGSADEHVVDVDDVFVDRVPAVER